MIEMTLLSVGEMVLLSVGKMALLSDTLAPIIEVQSEPKRLQVLRLGCRQFVVFVVFVREDCLILVI